MLSINAFICLNTQSYISATLIHVGVGNAHFNLPPLSIQMRRKVRPCAVWVSQVALQVKNPPANAGDVRDAGSIPGSGRSPEVGTGTPLQYSCLENVMG